MTTHSQEQLIHPKNVSTVAYLNNNNNNNNRQQANLLFSPYVCNHNDNIIPDKRFELPLHCIMGDYKQLFNITVVLWDTVIYCSRMISLLNGLCKPREKVISHVLLTLSIIHIDRSIPMKIIYLLVLLYLLL